MKHEYAFDVKLFAVVRVMAEDEVAARDAMDRVLDACSPTQDFLDGYNSVAHGVQITEASLCQDEGYPELMELDGEAL